MLTAFVELAKGRTRVTAHRDSEDFAETLALMPNPPATCPGCGGVVLAAAGSVRAYHFKHRSTTADAGCIFHGESPDHHRLKTEIYDIINTTPGWIADLEVRADNGDWIADVMATSTHTQKRIAFEIQLSEQDQRWAEERQRRRNKDAIECLWLVSSRGHGPKGATAHLPSRSRSQVYIARCTGTLESGKPKLTRHETDLGTVVVDYLNGQLLLSEDLEHPMHIDDYRRYCEALAQKREADRKHQQLVQEYRRRQAELAETKDHSPTHKQSRRTGPRDAYHQRQIDTARTIVPSLAARHSTLEVGDQLYHHDAAIVRGPHEATDVDYVNLRASFDYAYGLPVSEKGKVFAVISPNPWRIAGSLLASQAHRITVYCHPTDHAVLRRNYSGHIEAIISSPNRGVPAPRLPGIVDPLDP